MKKILVGMALLLLVLVGAGCSQKENAKDESKSDTWATIEKNKKLTVGLDDTFVPMGFRDEAGELQGFDIDLAKEVGSRLGLAIKFQPIDWSMKEFELDNGTIDLIWNGYSKTPEREKKVLFSDPYMKNDQVLVTPKAANITNFSEMKDKVLGAQNGSSGYDLFNSEPEMLKDIVKDNDAVLYASFNEALIDLKSGRIDGLLMDKVYANYYLEQNNELDKYTITTGDFAGEDFAIGARKADKTLIKKINETLAEMEEDGTFATISEKWFGEDVYPK